MYGSLKPPSSPLPGSRLFEAKNPTAAARKPDPRAHARALVESYGLRGAIDIARNNALFTRWREDYWPRVLDAMEEHRRGLRSGKDRRVSAHSAW
jgi:hypothetical protein